MSGQKMPLVVNLRTTPFPYDPEIDEMDSSSSKFRVTSQSCEIFSGGSNFTDNIDFYNMSHTTDRQISTNQNGLNSYISNPNSTSNNRLPPFKSISDGTYYSPEMPNKPAENDNLSDEQEFKYVPPVKQFKKKSSKVTRVIKRDMLNNESDLANLNLAESEDSIIELSATSPSEDDKDSDYSASSTGMKKKLKHRNNDNRYQKVWRKKFPSIHYDEARNLMFCKICREHADDKLHGRAMFFVHGTSNFKTQTIVRHLKSNLHKNCKVKGQPETKQLVVSPTENVPIPQHKRRNVGSRSNIDKRRSKRFRSRGRTGKKSNLHNPDDDGVSGAKTVGDKVMEGEMFVQTWQVTFPFISYDETRNIMFCSVCFEFAEGENKDSFVTGTNDFKKTTILRHASSKLHFHCQRSSDNFLKTYAPTEKRFLNSVKENLHQIFKLMYFLMKAKYPLRYFQYLNEKHNNHLIDFRYLLASYERVMPIFASCIAKSFKKDLLNNIQKAKSFTLVVDQTSNQVVPNQLIYMKFLERDEIKTHYLGIFHCPKSQSESLYENMSALFSTMGISNKMERMSYLMCDLPSEADIFKVDLISNLKRSPNDFVCDIPFLPHKMKSSKIFQKHYSTCKFCVVMRNIYWFCDVANASNILKNIGKELARIVEEYNCFPKDNFAFFYFGSLVAVKEDFILLVELLKRENNDKFDSKIKHPVRKLLGLVSNSNFPLILGLVLDIFECLENFSDKVENGDAMPFALYEELLNFSNGIVQSSEGHGRFYKEFSQKVDECHSGVGDYDCVFETVRPIGSAFELHLNTIIDNTPLLRYCRIFNTKIWPEDDSWDCFGDFEYPRLCETLGEADVSIIEWKAYKEVSINCISLETRKNPKLTAKHVIKHFRSEFPTIASVLEKLLLLDFESRILRKGNSKSCSLSHLEEGSVPWEQIQDLFTITMNDVPVSAFDPSTAVELLTDSDSSHFQNLNDQFEKDVQIIASDCEYFSSFSQSLDSDCNENR